MPSQNRSVPRAREENLKWRANVIRRWLEMKEEGMPSTDTARALGMDRSRLALWRSKGIDVDLVPLEERKVIPRAERGLEAA